MASCEDSNMTEKCVIVINGHKDATSKLNPKDFKTVSLCDIITSMGENNLHRFKITRNSKNGWYMIGII